MILYDLIRRIMPDCPRILLMMGMMVMFAASCKKEPDELGPTISISGPSEGTIFYFNDPIPVNATVNDDKKISQVVISITNAQGQVFLNTINVLNPSNPITISQTIAFDDLYLSSGTYYVRIIARDGENETVSFRQITLVESPKVLKRLYVFSDNGGQIAVDTLSGNQLNTMANLLSDYVGSQVFSKTSTLCMAHSGNKLSVLDALQLNELSSNTIPSIFGNSFFTCVSSDNSQEYFFVGCADGKVRRLSATGNLSELFVLSQGFVPKKILIHDQYLIVLQENILQTQRQIAVFNKYTGFMIQSAAIDFEVKALLNTNDPLKIILAGNADNQSEFRYYNIETNFTNGVFSLYNQSLISDAWPIASNRFMAAHADGIFLYDYDINSLSGGLSIAANNIIPDETSARCFVISDAGFHIINNSATQEVLFVAKSGIVDLGVVYNK